MNKQGTQHSLQTLLAQEVTCSESLLTCLQAERRALAQHDGDALEKTTLEKLEHTGELEQLEQQRETLIAGLGVETGQSQTKQFFNNLSDSDPVKQLWQQVLGNIEACRNENLTNGGILEASRQHVEQVLCILRGQSGAPPVYKPGGTTQANLGQRELGKV